MGRHEPALPSYEAAPPAPAPAPPAPPAPAPPAPAPPAAAPAPPAPAAAAPPSAGPQAQPWAEPDPPAQADVATESRAWTGMESPAWSDPARPAQAGPAGDDPDTGGPGLPKRVRQASLVPQLRNPPPAYPPLPGRFPDPRTPDEARATVSAIQHGWERGRSMFEPDAGQHSKSTAAGAPGSGESGTDHDEPGDYGAYQQGTPSDGRGPHGPA
jgi:hypothetical protein